ncbi:MAG: hypothetical protein WCL14_14770 [Bacteroidota bacterium]
MEPIAQETIDYADDFFFHMSEKQVKEKLDGFKVIQPSLHMYILFIVKRMSGRQQWLFFCKLMFILDYCFCSEYAALKLITFENLKRHMVHQLEANEEAMRRLEKEPVGLVELAEEIDDMNQELLLGYLQAKIELHETVAPILTELDANDICLTLLSFGFLYQQEMEKTMKGLN